MASPNFTFCPAFILKWNDFGASKIRTIVEPRLNSPNDSPFVNGTPTELDLEKSSS